MVSERFPWHSGYCNPVENVTKDNIEINGSNNSVILWTGFGLSTCYGKEGQSHRDSFINVINGTAAQGAYSNTDFATHVRWLAFIHSLLKSLSSNTRSIIWTPLVNEETHPLEPVYSEYYGAPPSSLYVLARTAVRKTHGNAQHICHATFLLLLQRRLCTE
jgi:hypothetical protein